METFINVMETFINNCGGSPRLTAKMVFLRIKSPQAVKDIVYFLAMALSLYLVRSRKL